MPRYFNDNYMTYDLNNHRYVLTEDALLEDYGIDLNSTLDSEGDANKDKLPERFLKRVSMMLYYYIYSWSQNRDDTEYVISGVDYREDIKQAMEELAYSFLINNTDPSLLFTGNTLKTSEVPPTVQTILMDSGLLFRGTYTRLPENYKDTRGYDY